MKLNIFSKATAGIILFGAAMFGNGAVNDADLTAKAIHQVRMYSRYSLWDNISVQTVNGNVEVQGQVSQPYKKSDLQRILQRIPGVTSVTNDLHVLPVSFIDDQLRVQVARAIFRDPVLSQYSLLAVPAIHIIVDNGHVTLEGVVNSELARNVATIRANGAGLSFGVVTNHLRVESPSKTKS
jgi:hyperosmotically inducible protein